MNLESSRRQLEQVRLELREQQFEGKGYGEFYESRLKVTMIN